MSCNYELFGITQSKMLARKIKSAKRQENTQKQTLEEISERKRERKILGSPYQRRGVQRCVEKRIIIHNKLVERENVSELIIDQCRNGA